jgi:hypothetical protein
VDLISSVPGEVAAPERSYGLAAVSKALERRAGDIR